MRSTALVLATTALAASLLLAGCFMPDAVPVNPPTQSASGGGGAGALHADVIMKDTQFQPSEVHVAVGGTVTWTNQDALAHTVTPDDKAAWGTEGSGDGTDKWLQPGQSWSFTFTKPGVYAFHCIPHSGKDKMGMYAGMTGRVIVGDSNVAKPVAHGQSIVPDPVAPALALPGPDGFVHLSLRAEEVVGQLADNTTYTYWTFNGTVPGPMLRVREGDRVMLTLENAGNDTMVHSIDLHAVTGPGGGAKVTQTAPGNATTFTFTALNPGLFVYHCASPAIPQHIANGMYGMILVEPKAGLPKADREYYVMQGEVYTNGSLGQTGPLTLDSSKLLAETPDYYTMNGAVGALTGAGALKASVNDTVRIFFGVGGAQPSSFHLIGEVFDRVHLDGNGPASLNRQTVIVPAAGAAMIELKVDYPGTYTLVDHTLTRTLDRGAAGQLVVTGWADPSIFSGTETPGSGH